MSEKTILTELNIYPIKSAAGISLTTAIVEPRGLQFDRRWMIVDETSTFITQRRFPRLSLISVQISSDNLILNAPGMNEIKAPLDVDGILEPVQIWDDKVQAVGVDKEVNKWLTEFLQISCRLVHMTKESTRPVDPKYTINKDHVSFADAFPFLLISESSLEDLNSKLDHSVPMNRFRPNLVVRGCSAFAEDEWRRIRIGNVIFHLVKPCARCVITTVNQANGTFSGKEPLKTLSEYRNRDGKVYFGQNVIGEGTGILNVGDTVTILD
jgi:uncharacterized protein